MRPNMYSTSGYLYFSIVSLTNLEELIVSKNKELNRLPDSVDKIESLRKLEVSRCNLTELPTRYVNREFITVTRVMLSFYSNCVITQLVFEIFKVFDNMNNICLNQVKRGTKFYLISILKMLKIYKISLYIKKFLVRL